MDITLYNIDSKKKIRYVSFSIVEVPAVGNIIKRSSGLVGGTAVPQPDITITSGKAGRTIDEQTQLEFNALISKARDKGYKDTADELSTVKTDDNGNKKPMLASDPKGKLETMIKGKKGYASTKLDGVRMLLGKGPDGFFSVSRGGKSYDVVCKNIFKEEGLEEFFEAYPDVYIDGELYQHGKSLEEISGAARKKEWDEDRHGELEFWVFDVLIEGMPFKDRRSVLMALDFLLVGGNYIKVIAQIPVNDYAELKRLHDTWVERGYEGAIWRDENNLYEVGGRPKSMLKMKLMQDAEFEIVGATKGLRPEDMVFVMKTKEGLTFEAKPIGNVVTRTTYLENIDSLIGKMATIKFFYISAKGVPNLPIFKHVRPDDE